MGRGENEFCGVFSIPLLRKDRDQGGGITKYGSFLLSPEGASRAREEDRRDREEAARRVQEEAARRAREEAASFAPMRDLRRPQQAADNDGPNAGAC